MYRNCHRFALLALALTQVHCEGMDEFLDSINDISDESSLGKYKEIPGDDVTLHLAPSLNDSGLDVDALLAGMNLGIEREAAANRLRLAMLDGEAAATPQSTDDATASFLLLNQRAKRSFEPSAFSLVDESELVPATETQLVRTSFLDDTVTWTHTSDQFVVSSTDKITVKQQGARNTCSAFAGIGQLEAKLIKKYSLSGIDLSEQRFYYMSRPDYWETGGDPLAGGSNAGTGYAKSNGYLHNGVSYPPGSPSTYNIPLESDCPYNPTRGNNDLQIPQPGGCETGVSKVTNFAAWVYQHQLGPITAQNIFDMLKDQDLPVILGTKLSTNWEVNDGMVTLAKAGTPGESSHARGHAYLAVGARKISETEFPGEGGMCFIVKNSWGRGWGTNGYSCITLAWFNAWRYSGSMPMVLDVTLDADRFAEAKSAILDTPDGLLPPDPATRTQDRTSFTQGRARRGTATFFRGQLAAAGDMQMGNLRGSDDAHYRVMYKVDTSTLTLQGLLQDGAQLTHELVLEVSGGILRYTEPPYGTIDVGAISEETRALTLCAGDYVNVCHFNYLKDSNELVIGLTRARALQEDSEGPYDWQSISFAGYGIDLSKPSGLNTKIDVRFRQDDVTTNPARFLIKPSNTDILFQGTAIGNFKDKSFCSGSFADVCNVLLTPEQFHVLFAAGK